jgi:hypothetical protein
MTGGKKEAEVKVAFSLDVSTSVAEAGVAESSKLKAERETKVYVCEIPKKLMKSYKQHIFRCLWFLLAKSELVVSF